MEKVFDSYYGKILLFGEYSVIIGSRALTIPFTHFRGSLGFMHDGNYTDLDFARRSNRSLGEFAAYLEKQSSSGQLNTGFHIPRLQADIKNGLFFESTIPQGYGVGSSGALVAAIYEAYAKNPLPPEGNMPELKQLLSVMEGHFHGTSSGLDPLIAYLKHPLMTEGKNEVKMVSLKGPGEKHRMTIFLIDTGMPGKTGPLVDGFLNKYRETDFRERVDAELIPLNNQCIKHFLYEEYEELWELLAELSLFQMKHFQPMIPAHFMQYWQLGLDTGLFTLKLLGSGGGGFILGFTRDYERTALSLHENGLRFIPVERSKK